VNRRPLVAEAVRRLADAGVASPEADAEILLAHVLEIDRSRLVLVDDVTDGDRTTYDALVGRRAAREPLQHLTGRAYFRHVELVVGPGTGSGAIAKAVADEVPHARVHAVEMDEAAHGWATRNLAGTGVDLRLGDLGTAFDELAGTVDVVVSNPPYIPLDAWESVALEVRDHDPALALWSGADGLDAMRVVEARAALLLGPGGVVGVEHAEAQGESAPGVFAATGRWADVRDHTDLAGRPRFVTARLAR
jgi:release factor glutamine methyltransferase